jgi:thiamine-phosphate pyrophosphorylase
VAQKLARLQLARTAQQLNRTGGSTLPPLVLLTDDERLPDPIAAARALPRGSLVILRARESARRCALAALLARLAHERNLTWLVAGDPWLASGSGACGVHFPERMVAQAARWRVRRPQWLITCAAHSFRACSAAARAGADAVVLAPVFATASHRGETCLGSLRARSIARACPVPIYALGGVDWHSARTLAGTPWAGLAAVGALSLECQSDGSSSGCAALPTTV